ncbi:MAG: hypothetical protein Q9222_003970 [Ikaeria aurantiellina]
MPIKCQSRSSQCSSEQFSANTQPSIINDQYPTTEDLLRTIHCLMKERSKLSQQLTLANRTIEELMQQRRHATTLALAARTTVNDIGASKTQMIGHKQDAFKLLTSGSLRVSGAGQWIGGSWLEPSVDALAPAAKAWSEGSAQTALILVGQVSQRQDLSVSEEVHAHLLMSAILRASGDIAKASEHAEHGLVTARNTGSHYILTSKAEFYRGLCWLSQNRFAQARWCFALASHLPGYEDQVEVNLADASERCRMSDLTSEGQKLELTSI